MHISSPTHKPAWVIMVSHIINTYQYAFILAVWLSYNTMEVELSCGLYTGISYSSMSYAGCIYV